MHIKFKNLCNASKHMNMHISNAIYQSSRACSPTCVLLLSKNFDPSFFFNVAPSLSMSMSNLYFFELLYLISPPYTISISKLSYLCTISPPLSSIFIKGVLLIDAKVYVWGRWLRLESCIFYGHLLFVGMTPLVDTTCKLYPLYLV